MSKDKKIKSPMPDRICRLLGIYGYWVDQEDGSRKFEKLGNATKLLTTALDEKADTYAIVLFYWRKDKLPTKDNLHYRDTYLTKAFFPSLYCENNAYGRWETIFEDHQSFFPIGYDPEIVNILTDWHTQKNYIIIETFSEYYSRNLAREVQKGMKESAYKCLHLGGKPPLGYQVNADQTYSINYEESPVIQKIFEMFLDGKSYKEIASALNNLGYKTRMGRTFTKNSIHDILRNEK